MPKIREKKSKNMKSCNTHTADAIIYTTFSLYAHQANSQQAVDLSYTRKLEWNATSVASFVEFTSFGVVVMMMAMERRWFTIEVAEHFNYLITLTPCIDYSFAINLMRSVYKKHMTNETKYTLVLAFF